MGRRNIILAGAAAALGVAVAGASAIGRDVAGRIRRVSDVAEQVSAGELDLEPLRPGGTDEVSRLAQAMDEMVVTLRGVNDQIDALAAGRSDDPSLAEELPGTIGRSLRGAITRLGRSTEELKRQATHDALTGLLDRHGLDQLIETVDANRSTGVGVVLLDLDGFKAVNDAHGHQMGDELLRAIATRLSDVARSSDVVARLGGDEFVVLLVPEADAVVAERVSNRIVDGVCEPVIVEGVELRVGASVGWVVATPETPLSVALRQADAAMYEAKRAGKGRAVRAVRV